MANNIHPHAIPAKRKRRRAVKKQRLKQQPSGAGKPRKRKARPAR